MARSAGVEPVPRFANTLLDSLPAGDKQRLRDSLVRVHLRKAHVLFRFGAALHHVYFPETAVVSLVVLMDDGRSSEVGMVGADGLVGVGQLLGTGRSPVDALCQVPGAAIRMTIGAFEREVQANGMLFRRATAYADIAMLQLLQTAACNALHTLEERLARWLLMLQDRLGDPRLPLTHEGMAQMLGVRRPSVTVVAGSLQRAGLIEYQRGVVFVRDRAGLEATACECYRRVAAVQGRSGTVQNRVGSSP